LSHFIVSDISDDAHYDQEKTGARRGSRINMQTAVAVLVSGVVALFGVTSAVLGFIAEANKLKVSETNITRIFCLS